MIVGLSIRLPLNTVIMPEITNSFLGTIAQVDAGF